MSEGELGRAIGELIGSVLGTQQPQPPPTPQQMNITRACLSAGLLAGCAYAPFFAAELTGKTVGVLLAEFRHAPLDPPAVLLAWLAAVVVGGVYLWVGLRGAVDGPHAALWAFWSAALPAAAGLAVWRHAPALFGNPMMRGVFLVAAVICAMRFWIAVRPGNTAQSAVQQHIQQNKVVWRSARRKT